MEHGKLNWQVQIALTGVVPSCTSGKVMDPELGEAFAELLDMRWMDLRPKAVLGTLEFYRG